MFSSLVRFFNKLATGKIQTEPCLPGPFGYKTAWYAIKGEPSYSVIQKLGLEKLCAANWESGIGYIYNTSDGEVFVSPVVEGYVLVIGLNGDHDMVKKHAALFDELQYFGNHRVADYYAWAMFSNGNLTRSYSSCGDTGEFWVEGKITAEEIELGFDKFPVKEICDDDYDKFEFADEAAVLKIAKAWGVDPLFADDERYEKSTGHICKFK